MQKIEPISLSEFSDRVKISDSTHQIDFLEYFHEFIKMAPFYAIGPFFWFIPDNSKMKIVEVSPNISSLTPFKQNIGKIKDQNFLQV